MKISPFQTLTQQRFQRTFNFYNKTLVNLNNKNVPLNEIVTIVGSNFEAVSLAQILNSYGIPTYLPRYKFDLHSDLVMWFISCSHWCDDQLKHSFNSLFLIWKKFVSANSKNESWLLVKVNLLSILKQSCSIELTYDWLMYLVKSLNIFKVFKDSERYPDELNNISLLLDEAKNGLLKKTSRNKLTQLEKPNNEITVTTRHSVKGLEFEAVIMCGMEEGSFPYYNIKEEKEMREAHRLCYVCVSRAKKYCFLLTSSKLTLPGPHGPWAKKCVLSRFWNILKEKFGVEDNIFTSKTYR